MENDRSPIQLSNTEILLLPPTITSNNLSIRENIGTNILDSQAYLYNSLKLSSRSKFALEVCDNVVAMFEF